MRWFAATVAAAVMASGCATHRASSPASTAGERQLHGTLSPTVESSDKALSAALLALAVMPTADAHRQVASEYRRLGVLDMAYSHYERAIELNPRDAAALDGLARIWRDWGAASTGLTYAYRAAHFAPDSPVFANTLGTLLHATGQVRAARQWYRHALNLDPTAEYAQNNLCYALTILEQPDALSECRQAVALAPQSPVAHNNLALAYAAAGDLKRASEEFHRVGTLDEARYNMGIVQLAARDFSAAARAFGSALQVNPEFSMAARRAKQAREAADTEDAQ